MLASDTVSVYNWKVYKSGKRHDREWLKTIANPKKYKGSSHICQKHLHDPKMFWDDVLWTAESKVELFRRYGFLTIKTLYLKIRACVMTQIE